jgi:2-polyprenyl-3-methyl-5-hydroxy-6-metoxy-1,4-benzoquinol methylase
MPERIHPGMAEWEQFGYEHVQRYQFAVPFAQNRRVLDAACGNGYGAEMLATQGAGEVVGVDADAAAIDAAQARASRRKRLTFRFEAVQERTRIVPMLGHRQEVCMQIILLLQKKDTGPST